MAYYDYNSQILLTSKENGVFYLYYSNARFEKKRICRFCHVI